MSISPQPFPGFTVLQTQLLSHGALQEQKGTSSSEQRSQRYSISNKQSSLIIRKTMLIILYPHNFWVVIQNE